MADADAGLAPLVDSEQLRYSTYVLHSCIQTAMHHSCPAQLACHQEVRLMLLFLLSRYHLGNNKRWQSHCGASKRAIVTLSGAHSLLSSLPATAADHVMRGCTGYPARL